MFFQQNKVLHNVRVKLMTWITPEHENIRYVGYCPVCRHAKGFVGYSCESYFCAWNALGSGMWRWASASVRSYAELSRVGAGWLHFTLCMNLNLLTVIMFCAGNGSRKSAWVTHAHQSSTRSHIFTQSAPTCTYNPTHTTDSSYISPHTHLDELHLLSLWLTHT